MHLTDFSDLILRLNDSATELAPRAHQDALIKILSGLVQFDAAWWGWSSFAGGRTTIVNTATFGVSHGFESAFRVVAHQDPLLRHGRDLTVFAKSIEVGSAGLGEDFRNFLRAFDIGAVLNGHCRLHGATEFNFFMSLYRRSGSSAFSDEQTTDFRLILRHLEQSLSQSLRTELRASAPRDGEAALISEGGAVIRATRGFRDRLREEGVAPSALNALLLDMASHEKVWTGQHVSLVSRRYSAGLMLVQQAPVDSSAQLSTEERKVAELLLAGFTMRQVSEKKQVSLNTVRNQVTSIYRKTGVSGRLELVQKLGGFRQDKS